MAGSAKKKTSQHRTPEGDPPPKKTVSANSKNSKTSLKKEFNKKANKPLYAGKVAPAEKQRLNLTGKTRFIITSAQNNTKVHEGFLSALETYAKENKAELIVSQFTYNKNGFQNSTKDDVEELWYDSRIKPYLLSELTNTQTGKSGSNQSIQLAKGLIFGGELDILPTAARPTSGFEKGYFRGQSGIIPHAKHEMVSLPGMKEDGAHFLYTTGACTKRNYIERKAGQKADSHHTYGALVVEVDKDGDWFVRQIVADDTGAFYDLTDKYLPSGKVLHDQRVEAITHADIHVEKMDAMPKEVVFGQGGMLDQLKPKYQFIHDIIDFTSRNHHNIDNPFFRHQQHIQGSKVENEISLAAEFLKAAERKDTQTIVVESNHDRAFTKWLSKVDNIKNDPQNAAFFHECLAKIYREMEKGNMEFVNQTLEWAIREKQKLNKTEFLPHDTSFKICPNAGGIECGLHGDIGPNGARGSANAFTSLGDKSNVAHAHSAGIRDGVFTSGVFGLKMGYNTGPSSWSYSETVTYPNGKRAIVTIKNGKFRGDFNKAAKKDNVVPLKPKNAKKTSGPGRKAA